MKRLHQFLCGFYGHRALAHDWYEAEKGGVGKPKVMGRDWICVRCGKVTSSIRRALPL